MNATNSSSTIGGLSHLVEAATALTKLVEPQVSVISSVEISSARLVAPRTIVSDDDEEAKKLAKRSPSPSSSREIFPQRLMQILADASLTDVVSWLPHGRSFVIIRPDVFSERVLPLYFPSTDSRSSTKYPSFTRKLNRWGFRQATRGPDTGAFHHPLFRRAQSELCLDMVCQKSRKRGATKGTKNKTTTDVTSEAPSTGSQHASSSRLTKETLATLPAESLNHMQTKTVSLSSGDDSLSSPRSSAPTKAPLSPWVPSDPKLVAATLRAREEQEKLTVAKSMLYEAYLSALRG
eukprot:CAMPEP_0119021842 /NCGR_PEP_ID=MMETSP1176-20130426/26816_1 /TAXON_ID=265551 /ORGANISM="Synedropsis recta cf, Strain CCMP1620" /LENGTH=292 /DNA_ID=CAMNT_0006976541 /DNA_START=31 /DNA_END=909 /DNA_ORIENTATION=+